jgi:UDP-3-O-acyl-N-acetylglucosamine deacetylase
MNKQQTISKPVSLKGVGIHSGNEVNLTLNLQTKILVMHSVELTFLESQLSKQMSIM